VNQEQGGGSCPEASGLWKQRSEFYGNKTHDLLLQMVTSNLTTGEEPEEALKAG
jgi:hypothetical protein